MPWSSTPRSRSNAVAAMTAAIVLAVSSGVPARGAAAPTAEYAVIVSKAVEVDSLTVDELRRILTFRRTHWKAGQAVQILLPPTGSETRKFLLSRIYNLSEADLRRLILERIFQAEIDFAPKVVNSDRDAVAFVASGRSMIAVVDATTRALRDVRVIRIDGKLSGDAGYPLR